MNRNWGISGWINALRWGGLALVIAGYAAWLFARMSPEPGGSDASGYLNLARSLQAGRAVGRLRVVDGLPRVNPRDFTPEGYVAAGGRAIVPTYSVGLPLHLAAAATLTNWHLGPLLVEAAAAFGTLALVYRIGRELGVRPAIAGAMAACLACSSAFLFGTIAPLSDTLAALWCSLAFWCALRAQAKGAAQAAFSGAAFAVAVAVRPTDGLMLPVLCLLLWRPRLLLSAAAGALPFALGLGLYNHALYGSPFRTGYGYATAQFGAGGYLAGFAFLLRWLVRLLPMACLSVLAPLVLARRGRGRTLIALLLWAAIFPLVYAAYRFLPYNWTSLRFLVPAFPAYLALAGLVIESGLAALPEDFLKTAQDGPKRRAAASLEIEPNFTPYSGQPRRWAVAACAIICVLASVLSNATFRLPDAHKHDVSLVKAAAWIRSHAPASTVFVADYFSGMLYFDTPSPIIRFDQAGPRETARYIAGIRRLGRPVIAVLTKAESHDPRFTAIPGGREKVASFADATLWRLGDRQAGETARGAAAPQ